MARFGTRLREVTEYDLWLIFSSEPPSVRLTAGYPSLARNERAMNLKVALPNAIFEAPSLSATIKVDSPTHAATIDMTAAVEAVRQAIGMDVDIVIQGGPNG